MSSTAVSNDLAKQYQRKTDKQHILDNPDTYINNQYDRRGPPMEIRESLYIKKMEG